MLNITQPNNALEADGPMSAAPAVPDFLASLTCPHPKVIFERLLKGPTHRGNGDAQPTNPPDAAR